MTEGRDADETREPRPDEEQRTFREEADSLFRITLAPTAWAGHFVLSYAAVSVGCQKLGGIEGGVRPALILLTVAVLALIGWIGWRAFRQWDVRNTGEFSNPEGKAEHRHQFLGHAGFLLALISFIGVVYTGLPLLLLQGCR